MRLKGLNNLNNPIIITNKEQRFVVSEQMRSINVKPDSIILEPIGKNTAPTITLATLKELESSNDPFLLILSSDHKIEDEENFKSIIEFGLRYVNNGRLVTFRVEPDNPETGYGYIESLLKVFETFVLIARLNFILKLKLKRILVLGTIN